MEAACCSLDAALASWIAELENGGGPSPQARLPAERGQGMIVGGGAAGGEMEELRGLAADPDSFVQGLMRAASAVLRGQFAPAGLAGHISPAHRAVPPPQRARQWLQAMEELVERLRGQLEEQ